MNHFEFRFANNTDIDQLIKLRFQMQKEVHKANEIVLNQNYRNKLIHFFNKNITSKSYVSAVAEIDNKIISAIGLSTYEKPPSITGASGIVGYITNVYTLPDYRGNGIASELMRMIIQYAKENQFDKLHLTSIDSAKKVYDNAGFKRPRYIPMELIF